MPKVFRVMLIEDGKPKIGPSKRMLGVKIDGLSPDIEPDANGDVSPGADGMSVAPSFSTLPIFLVPDRFSAIRPGARGKNSNNHCWSMGNGDFISNDINDSLNLLVDRPGEHGVVRPRTKMPVADFQDKLAATQNEWIIDEPELSS